MVAGKMKCCGCPDCLGKNCYKAAGTTPTCAHPCCWCVGLQGLTTCDSEYFTELQACFDQIEDETEYLCFGTQVSVTLDIPSNVQVEKLLQACGEPDELRTSVNANLNPVYQITNVGIFGPAEDAGDAPFVQACSNSVYFECNTYTDRDPGGDSGICDGDPLPDNGSCWQFCPDAGNMWKPSHHTIEGTNAFDAGQTVSFTLDRQSNCTYLKRVLLPGSGQRIWLEPNGSRDYYDTDTAACTGGNSSPAADCTTPEGADCCHCKDCPELNDLDCDTAENGCIRGFCDYGEEAGLIIGECGGQSANPFPRLSYCEGGYTKHYVTVKFVLSYELDRFFGNADEGNAGDLVWRHRVSLEPFFLFSGDTLSVSNNSVSYQYDPANRPAGDWAPIVGGANYQSGPVIQCNSQKCPGGSGTGVFSALSDFDDWTRCEYAEKFLTYGVASECGCTNVPLGCEWCSHDDWCNTASAPPVRLRPNPHLPITSLQSFSLNIPDGCTQNGESLGDCSGTVYMNGSFLNGKLFEHLQRLNGTAGCFTNTGCPSATSFTGGGIDVTVTVA